MSTCCHGGSYPSGFMGSYAGGSKCLCDFPTLVILILIVLQFSNKNKNCHHDDDEYGSCSKEKFDQIGNGVLFIIAIFFLSCIGCGRH